MNFYFTTLLPRAGPKPVGEAHKVVMDSTIPVTTRHTRQNELDEGERGLFSMLVCFFCEWSLSSRTTR